MPRPLGRARLGAGAGDGYRDISCRWKVFADDDSEVELGVGGVGGVVEGRQPADGGGGSSPGGSARDADGGWVIGDAVDPRMSQTSGRLALIHAERLLELGKVEHAEVGIPRLGNATEGARDIFRMLRIEEKARPSIVSAPSTRTDAIAYDKPSPSTEKSSPIAIHLDNLGIVYKNSEDTDSIAILSGGISRQSCLRFPRPVRRSHLALHRCHRHRPRKSVTRALRYGSRQSRKCLRAQGPVRPGHLALHRFPRIAGRNR